MGKTIGVISLKGGVGKTSSVVSLGKAIADFGKSVLLVDANLSAPNLGAHLNILNPEKTLHHVLDRTANVKDVICEVEENFHLLPASMMYKGKINPLKLKDKLSYWKGKYDYILIDSSPALNDETLGAMLASDGLLVVTTPDIPTLDTTMKAVKFAKSRGTPIMGIILNRVYGKKFELSLEDIEDVSGVPVMAIIPHDINVLKAQSEFEPLISHKPRAESSEEYKKLAASLIGEKYKPVRLKGLVNWISPKKQEINRQIYYTSIFR